MQKRDYSISILRILGMFMIIGCHIASFLNMNMIAMILNVGVEIFLIISGYLYANKEIKNNKEFIIQRYKKIVKPLIITVAMYIILAIASKKSIDINALPFLLFNIQGLNFLISIINIPQISGLAHTWFLTIIMICYLLLVILKLFENKYSFNYSKRSSCLFIIILIVLDLIFVPFGLQLGYFVTFFVGYILGKKRININNRFYFLSTIVLILTFIVRLVGRKVFDNTILYNNVIVIYTQIIMALWFFFTVKWLYKKSKYFNYLSKKPIIKSLDSYTFYIYLSHYMFIVGELSVKGYITNVYLQLFAILILTIISSLIIKKIDSLL